MGAGRHLRERRIITQTSMPPEFSNRTIVSAKEPAIIAPVGIADLKKSRNPTHTDKETHHMKATASSSCRLLGSMMGIVSILICAQASAASIYPAWKDGGTYTAGTVVNYSGHNYRARVNQTDTLGA